jgi:hypothetical protein
MTNFEPSAHLKTKIKAFASGMTEKEKDDFVEILTDYSAEFGVALSKEFHQKTKEGFLVLSSNLSTLLR